ncbi:MAG: formylglycine-generating enzyme family protein [Synergistaceae bacterium]|jgi:formylglycine-generating enzyme required for sulfatase activity|nr:formylglycine-generating enzyme family protein [Synergistaceae bacterium]
MKSTSKYFEWNNLYEFITRLCLSLLFILVLSSCKESSPVSSDTEDPVDTNQYITNEVILNLSPANNATDIPYSSVILKWAYPNTNNDTLLYDVYFGNDSTLISVTYENLNVDSLYVNNLLSNTYYYRKIVVKNNKGILATSDVWSFKTEAEVIPVITTDMVSITGGTFSIDTVNIAISNFKIDKYEVTYPIWTEVRDWAISHGYSDLASGSDGRNPNGTNNPVVGISWYDAVKWCNARSEKEGFTPAYYTDSTKATVYRIGSIDINIDAVNWAVNGYRLPTEAEWNFAARGSNNSMGYTYSGGNDIEAVAWYSLNAGSTTHDVGLKLPNELGLYDMSGNTDEWCWDWYTTVYPNGGSVDPKGPSTTQSLRVLRGGIFYWGKANCDIDFRNDKYPNGVEGFHGFRCASSK